MVAAGWPLKARAEGPECSRCGRGPPGGRTGGRAEGRIALVRTLVETLVEAIENPFEILSEKPNQGCFTNSPIAVKNRRSYINL